MFKHFKDPVVTRIMRDEKIPIISFVANTGGLLGLCMGFSLVSVFEIVFHCGGAVKKEFMRRKRQQTSHKTENSNHAVVQNHITGYSFPEENNDAPVDNAIEYKEDGSEAATTPVGFGFTSF
mgnify:CR=1 FL=1